MAVLWAHMYAAPPSLHTRLPDQSAAVDEVFARALAKSPEDRYGTCAEFVAALRTAFGASAATVPGTGTLAARQGETDIASPGPDDPEEVTEEVTATIPRLASGARGPGHSLTDGTGAETGQAAEDPGSPVLPVPPVRKRYRGRPRPLVIALTVVIAAVVGAGALLAVHPWAHPPVLTPAGLRFATAAGGSDGAVSVEIAWSGPVAGPVPDAYAIFRDGTQVGTVLGTETSYTDDGLTPNTSYGFQVRAVRGGERSPVSATLTAQTPPLRPTGLGIRHKTTTSLEIAWSGPAAGPPPGEYEVLRDGAERTTVRGSVTRYTDKGLAPDTAYSYQVVAVTGDERSAGSPVLASARTTMPPLSAAVLGWSGQVTEKATSLYPAAPGWPIQPGTTTQDDWSIAPDCSSGPCDAKLSGAYDGWTYTMRLTRSGPATPVPPGCETTSTAPIRARGTPGR